VCAWRAGKRKGTIVIYLSKLVNYILFIVKTGSFAKLIKFTLLLEIPPKKRHKTGI
jgi:hypothetical protein